MGFSNPAARRAFFAGKKAKEKELKGEGFTASPNLKLPDLEKELKKALPKPPKFPKISSMMKIPRK